MLLTQLRHSADAAQLAARGPWVGDVVASALVVVAELSDGAVADDVEASGTEGDAKLVVDEDVPAAVVSVAGSCAGVEVEETNGGACWI